MHQMTNEKKTVLFLAEVQQYRKYIHICDYLKHLVHLADFKLIPPQFLWMRTCSSC